MINELFSQNFTIFQNYFFRKYLLIIKGVNMWKMIEILHGLKMTENVEIASTYLSKSRLYHQKIQVTLHRNDTSML